MYFFRFCSFQGAVVPVSNRSLLFSKPQEKEKRTMMSIGHTMSSFPHTSGGNLLTPKKCSLAHFLIHMTHLSTFPPSKPLKPTKGHQKTLIHPFSHSKRLFFLKNHKKPSKRVRNSQNIKKGIKILILFKKGKRREKYLNHVGQYHWFPQNHNGIPHHQNL